jgi:hypothetical protein
MGRRYAAILGSLAFGATMARGLVHHCGMEATLWDAMTYLVFFAVVGGLAGALAAWIVEDYVRDRIEKEVAELARQTNS